MLDISQFKELFFRTFPYEPTPDQWRLTEELSDFLSSPDAASLFVLKGYAGTGKTTVVSSLVKILPLLKAGFVLLAPTGRAAKVLSSYSGKPASTIHRKIYSQHETADGLISLSLTPNKHVDTLFIVDEASMIAFQTQQEEYSLFGDNNLLDDLISFVYSGENCRMIVIGDSAQLPPVKSHLSPALDVEFLKNKFHLKVFTIELKQVVRQEADSGILYNATKLRLKIAEATDGFTTFETEEYKDFIRLQGADAADEINDAFSQRNFEESIIIIRSNKRANLYNRHIRQRVLFLEDELSAGDLLMVVKNNYFWLPTESQAGFIANGDIIEVLRIQKTTEIYGFRFAHISARMLDYPGEPDLETIVFLDTLYIDAPALGAENTSKLWQEVSRDHEHEPSKRKRTALTRGNPYLNALQVKFAYALTCHKAQGGQWKNVFVEMGYIPESKPDTAYYRWLYTAFTRATSKLFLMGFSDDFFGRIFAKE